LTTNLERSHNDKKEAIPTQNTGIRLAHQENLPLNFGKQDTDL
jgi:hypothetical protein